MSWKPVLLHAFLGAFAICGGSSLLDADRSVIAQEDVVEHPVDTEPLRAVIERVLSDADFRHLRPRESEENDESFWPEWLRRFFRWLADQFEFDPSGAPEWGGVFLRALVWFVLAATIAVLVWLIARAIRARPARETLGLDGIAELDELLNEPEGPPGDLSVEEWLAHARAASESGDPRRAIRCALFAGRSFLERSGRIRFRRGLTNRDYLRVTSRDTKEREAFAVLARHFEEVFFGRRTADEARFRDCVNRVEEAFDESSPAS